MFPRKLTSPFSLRIKNQLAIIDTPWIMGILNITPDSFSDGGKYKTIDTALLHTEKMIRSGAKIIDIGAQSTRPGAKIISAEEELERVKICLPEIRKAFPDAILSIDTFYGKVLDFASVEGVDICNDISAMSYCQDMRAAVELAKLPYILMHGNESIEEMHVKKMKGNPILTINYFFSLKIKELATLGLHDIILDSGFGFGKTMEEQEYLVTNADQLYFGQFPLLAGVSKKSFIQYLKNKKPINPKTQEEIMLEIHISLLKKGIQILRVHDVDAGIQAVKAYLELPKT